MFSCPKSYCDDRAYPKSEGRARDYFRFSVPLPSILVASSGAAGLATRVKEVNSPSQREAEVRSASTVGVDVGLRLLQGSGRALGPGDASAGAHKWHV